MERVSVDIPDWLDNLLAMPVLLYRRVRYGYAFRRIRMAQPRYAKVDPADYKRLRKYEWFAMKGIYTFYIYRCVPGGKVKKRKLISLHKEIIKAPAGMVIDHINHDGMDNRSANLRTATYSQNVCHRKKHSDSKFSKYKGVYRKKKNHKWEVRISFEKKQIHIGCFRNEIDAAKAYDEAAMKYHGQFACLNFPDCPVRPWRRWFRI